MKAIANLFCLLFVATCVDGCIPIPFRFTERPPVFGLVIDRETKAPLEKATVTITVERGDVPPGVATTGTDGQFYVRPKRLWSVYLIPADYFSLPFNLSVESPAYAPFSKTFFHRVTDSGKNRKAEVIELDRLPR